MNVLTKLKLTVSTVALALCLSAPAEAGSFILDLTDADDHGNASGTANFNGWLYMQKVLENLAPGVTNGQKTVVQLGASGGRALSGASSAFTFSSLNGSGWNWVNIDGAANIASYLAGNAVAGVSLATTGLLQLDSGSKVSGGSDTSERAAFAAGAAAIDSFLGGGGGLHSMAQGGTNQYGWLSTLLPGLTFNSNQNSGLSLTAAGTAAFPSLTNGDLSAGPYHGQWTGGLGGLTVLFKDTNGGQAVGIGSDGGSITDPGGGGGGDVAEPATLALLGLGVMGIAMARRRRSIR